MGDTRKTDVLIVGAGPTGLSLACQLTRYGIDFIVLEKREGVTPYSKALGVHARTLEIYEQMGLAAQAVEEGTIAGRVRLVEAGEPRAEFDLSRVGEGMSAYPYMLVFEQSKNERLLYDYLRSHGKDVDWQTELDSFTHSEEGVTAQAVTPGGDRQTIEAKYIVGCDGPGSVVRHTLGLTFEGSTFERLFYVADVRIDWKLPHDALHICLTQNSLVAIFPMKGEKRYRIVGDFPEGVDREAADIPFEEIEQRIRKESQIDLTISDVNWFSVYKVHSRHTSRFSVGRCFLAGDSAHVHTPAGGQGMNTGIQDAYNLAWKLACVLRGHAHARILATYEQERIANAKRLLATTDQMFNIAASPDWLLRTIRTTIFPPLARTLMSSDVVKKRFFPLISQIGITYRDSALSDHDGDAHFAVKAGDRMPYFLVEGASVYDRLRAPKFHLVQFSDGTAEPGSAAETVEREFGSMVDCCVLPLYPHVVELFGSHKPFALLLRPDNHIGVIAPANPVEAVRDYLTRVVGASAQLAAGG
jgi:2-polyprenyl-6-methoxyphenol hydroxylase-like FAD-dependent oxidoreductase